MQSAMDAPTIMPLPAIVPDPTATEPEPTVAIVPVPPEPLLPAPPVPVPVVDAPLLVPVPPRFFSPPTAPPLLPPQPAKTRSAPATTEPRMTRPSLAWRVTPLEGVCSTYEAICRHPFLPSLR